PYDTLRILSYLSIPCALIILYLLLAPYSHLLFFFTDTATPEIYTLSLHDALPISSLSAAGAGTISPSMRTCRCRGSQCMTAAARSEEHTSELQSRFDLVCRLLLEKKKKKKK